jgi:uncharacterized protein YjiS (DUF1127 family)
MLLTLIIMWYKTLRYRAKCNSAMKFLTDKDLKDIGLTLHSR